MGEEKSLSDKSFSNAKVLWQLSLKTEDLFFSFASIQLFLIYFKVNIRALSRVSLSSPNSKVYTNVDYNFIWLSQFFNLFDLNKAE